jgi:DNA-binding CsgD family transcriptional regulator
MAQLSAVRSDNTAFAFHIASGVTGAEWEQQADAAAGTAIMPLLDLLLVSIVLADHEARILYANRRAKALLAEGRTLRNCMGRLSAANSKCAAELRRAIVQASMGDVPSGNCGGVPVPLSLEDRPELTAWVLPLQRASRAGRQRQAAIFLQEKRETFSRTLFARRFGATPAEMRILDLLLKGLTTGEIADTLNISFNTVRTHLKALFAKTDTCRQTDLVRLAASTVGPACLDD